MKKVPPPIDRSSSATGEFHRVMPQPLEDIPERKCQLGQSCHSFAQRSKSGGNLVGAKASPQIKKGFKNEVLWIICMFVIVLLTMHFAQVLIDRYGCNCWQRLLHLLLGVIWDHSTFFTVQSLMSCLLVGSAAPNRKSVLVSFTLQLYKHIRNLLIQTLMLSTRVRSLH